MDAFHILPWDSQFFGFTVARIVSSDITSDELSRVLTLLRLGKVRLVYWSTDHKTSAELINNQGGRLVDLKTTYSLPLGNDIDRDRRSSRRDILVEPYDSSMPTDVLRALAIQSGIYSRFAVDTNFPDGRFEEMYKLWMDQSLAKVMADEVLVIRANDGRVAAMATLSVKAEAGEVGLLAVDHEFRGRGYGASLLRRAEEWFVDRKCRAVRIITQGANVPACRLYEKCGYALEHQSHYFHFWLDDEAGAIPRHSPA